MGRKCWVSTRMKVRRKEIFFLSFKPYSWARGLKGCKPNELEILTEFGLHIFRVWRMLLLPDVERWIDGYTRKELEEEVHSVCGLGRGSVAVIEPGRGLGEWGGF